MFEVGATRLRSGCHVRGGGFKPSPATSVMGHGSRGRGWDEVERDEGRGDKAGARSEFQWEESLSLIENSTEYIVQGKGKKEKC